MLSYTLGWSGFGWNQSVDRGIRLRALYWHQFATASTIVPLFHTISHFMEIL